MRSERRSFLSKIAKRATPHEPTRTEFSVGAALPNLGGYNAVNLVFGRRVLRDILVQVVFKKGETNMGEKGKKDKGSREQRKKAKRTPEEKRQAKREKKSS